MTDNWFGDSYYITLWEEKKSCIWYGFISYDVVNTQTLYLLRAALLRKLGFHNPINCIGNGSVYYGFCVSYFIHTFFLQTFKTTVPQKHLSVSIPSKRATRRRSSAGLVYLLLLPLYHPFFFKLHCPFCSSFFSPPTHFFLCSLLHHLLLLLLLPCSKHMLLWFLYRSLLELTFNLRPPQHCY